MLAEIFPSEILLKMEVDLSQSVSGHVQADHYTQVSVQFRSDLDWLLIHIQFKTGFTLFKSGSGKTVVDGVNSDLQTLGIGS